MNSLENLRSDAPSGVVVFFVAVPLCLGIALASGAPLFSGLIAGIIGGLVVGAVSGSALGVSGPAAGLTVIVLGAIQDLGFSAFLLAVVFAGVLQIAMGVARAGVIAYFFPSSVIKGMLAGIGIIIILKQIPHALGHDSDPEGDLAFAQPDGDTTISAFSSMLGDFEPSAILISATALAILLLWESKAIKNLAISKVIQGPLAAVSTGVLIQWLAAKFAPSFALNPSHLVEVPVAQSWTDLTGFLTFPDWTQIGNPAIYITAITLAVVASLETLLCVEATDKLDPQRRVTPTNRELVAQGVGNMASGAIGGLPVTQVIVRSSANILSGGKTKVSTIIHGSLLLAAVVLLPTVLNMVPLAVLASILFVVGYKLAKPSIFRDMWDLGPSQFGPFVVTVLGIVFTNLLLGIGLGMAVAIIVILERNYRDSHFLQMEPKQDGSTNRVSVVLAEEVTFLNKGAIVRALSEIPDDTHIRIDFSKAAHIDHDILEAIGEFEESATNRNITVERIEQSPKE